VRAPLLIVLALAGSARADSLWEAEVRAGYGVAMTSTEGTMSARSSPLTVEATGSLAINEDPSVSAVAGVVVETLNRSGVGAIVGARLDSGPIRLSGGGTWIFAPDTLWGAQVSVGTCHRMARTTSICGDLQLATFFAGTDLAKDHTVTEIQLGFGVAFDAP
jgi:hypothetical protein